VSVPQFLDRHSVVGMVADVQINVIASPAHRMKGRAGVIHAVNAKAEHVVASATIGGLRHIPDLFVHRDVVTAVAGVQRGVRAGPDQVVPITAIDQPSVTSRVDIVIAIATIDGDRLARKIDIVLAAATIQRRIARVELQTSIPGLDIPQAAIDRIRAVAGADPVIPSPAIDHIIPTRRGDLVAQIGADDDVVVAVRCRPVDDVRGQGDCRLCHFLPHGIGANAAARRVMARHLTPSRFSMAAGEGQKCFNGFRGHRDLSTGTAPKAADRTSRLGFQFWIGKNRSFLKISFNQRFQALIWWSKGGSNP